MLDKAKTSFIIGFHVDCKVNCKCSISDNAYCAENLDKCTCTLGNTNLGYFIHSCIYSFSSFGLESCFMPGTILRTRNPAKSMTLLLTRRVYLG